MDPLKLDRLPPEYSIDGGTAFLSQRRDTVAVPVIWIVSLLSVLLHAVVLFLLPPLRFALPPAGEPDISLAVELRPRLQLPRGVLEPPASAAKPNVAPPPVAAAPRTPPRAEAAPSRVPPPAPPVTARAQPAPDAMASLPTKPETTAPEQVRVPSTGDFAAYVEARRRSRGESAPAPARPAMVPEPALEDDEARSKRIVAANLGLDRAPTFGKPGPSGGVFQVTRLNYNDAELLFFGWNKEIRRNTTQLIEVRKAEHSDIRIAVIRRMISIVREYETGDFRWESQRLGRDVILSARPTDTAGLEDFLMREFFEPPRP